MSDFAALVADFHALLTRDPNARVFLGLLDGLDGLPDPSAERWARDAADALALRARLDALPPTDDFDESLDRDLAGLTLDALRLHATLPLNGRPQVSAMPRVADAVGAGIFLIFVNDPRPDAERLETITARLDAVPAYVEAALAALDRPLARWVSIDDEKVAGLPGLFETIAAWAERIHWDGTPRLQSARERAVAALADYRVRLAALPTESNVHVGAELAQRIVHSKGIDKSLADLHAMARDFLAETTSQLDELRGRLVPKYDLPATTTNAELHGFLNKRFPVAVGDGGLDDILARYEAERARLRAWCDETGLFEVFDDQDMKIMRTPPFMEPSIPAGAMMPPPAFRPGIATSLVYLTLKADQLDEHTELGIPMMMVHEGIPGHHLQLAWAARHPSIVRRHYDGAHHAEGWTTMLEDYMLDQGYLGDLVDEARFATKRDISRIGARVAIDLYLMTGDRDFLEVGVPFDRDADAPWGLAGSLLQQVTGFTPGRVQAELNWYSQERGYPLSYLTGNRMVWDIKRGVQEAQAGRLDAQAIDRAFHRVYLESGNMPVSMLRRVFVHEGLLPA